MGKVDYTNFPELSGGKGSKNNDRNTAKELHTHIGFDD
jgi:hypothetical protein